jgi:hypothetical protein
MRQLRAFLKRVLPARFVDWYRRRRALRYYLRDLSHDLLVRQTALALGEIEEDMALHRDRLREAIAHDVLIRTDVILQELDRHIEGVATRTGQRLDDLQAQLERLREDLERLRAALGEEVAGSDRLDVAEPTGVAPKDLGDVSTG